LEYWADGFEFYQWLPRFGLCIGYSLAVCSRLLIYDLGHGEQFRTRAFVESFLVDHGFTLASRPHDPRDYFRDDIFGIAPAPLR
jgi:hypothetical protein